MQKSISDARIQSPLEGNFILPPVADFELKTIISTTALPSSISAKQALARAKEGYLKDLRSELKRALSYEQRLQHKNMHVMKLSAEVAKTLLRAGKAISKNNARSKTSNQSKKYATNDFSALQELGVLLSKVSEQAHGVLTRLNTLSHSRAKAQEFTRGKTPLLNQYFSSAQKLNSVKKDEEFTSVTETGHLSEAQLKSEEDFQHEDYQFIMESNISRYRETITRRKSQSLMNKAVSSSEAEEHSEDSKTIASDPSLTKKSSLRNFSNSKSSTTVHETTLNSLHKKFRINPHPFAIYNDTLSMNLTGGIESFREEPHSICDESPYLDTGTNKDLSSWCATETLYLKLLLIAGSSSIRSIGSEIATSEVDSTKNAKEKDRDYKMVEQSSSKDSQSLFSLLPVQKHSPLHHTHRPSQSILKKKST